MSQTTRLLKAIRDYPKYHFGKGIPNHKLSEISLKYSSRIAELRQDGCHIVAVRDYFPNGRASGTFRYYLTEETE